MTKADLLAKLDENNLKGIAKNEGFSIPKNYSKRDLVKYLDGLLTLKKIKEYTTEVYEKETRREIIRETIKERRIKVKSKEETKLQINKAQLIFELRNCGEKIEPCLLEEIASSIKEPFSGGKGAALFDKMNDPMLNYVHRIFVKKESDKKGLFLEYRTANFIKRHSDFDVEYLKIRTKLPQISEIDVLGYDSKDNIVVMAECKDRNVKKEDVAKWIENTRRIYTDYGNTLEESYFVTSSKLTNENIEYIETSKDVIAKTGQLKTISGLLGRISQNLNDSHKNKAAPSCFFKELRRKLGWMRTHDLL